MKALEGLEPSKNKPVVLKNCLALEFELTPKQKNSFEVHH